MANLADLANVVHPTGKAGKQAQYGLNLPATKVGQHPPDATCLTLPHSNVFVSARP
ncbi:MAG: hypothetical protein KA084_00675 [Brachymonas sp.]|nr:hypothetical protein [Brachymonas sp.]MBP6966344.1 hypothetical protein [Brachymonas sp.]MBP7246325.1 hypothetical protein [Brachymonas sp.]MBP7724700.1 hypothetical protein [Brachymonas sp.]MBP7733894.1 hypothetical protein [Brachymonas sp.]